MLTGKKSINKASEDTKAGGRGPKRDDQGKFVPSEDHKKDLADAIATLKDFRKKYKRLGEAEIFKLIDSLRILPP